MAKSKEQRKREKEERDLEALVLCSQQSAFTLDKPPDPVPDDECSLADSNKSRMYYGIVRIVVIIVVIVSAACLSYLAYKFARDWEVSEFEAKFQDFADEIIRSSVNNARNSRTVLESFSRTVTSLSLFANTTWPFLTIPNYETRSHDYLTISKAESLTFSLVVPTAAREAYENYTLNNQGWIQEGIDYEYLISLSTPQDDHSKRAEDAIDSEPATVAPGTNMEGFSVLNKAKPIQPFIWNHAPLTHRAVPEVSKGPWVPIWQTYPAPRNSYVVGNNLLSVPEFARLIRSSQRKQSFTPTVSSIFDNNFALFGNAQTIDVDPKSVILQPILRKMQNQRQNDIVGYMVVIKKWHQIFQDVLYNGAKPVIVVLRNTGDYCDAKEFTYKVDGSSGEFVGTGDLHDKRYDSLVASAPLFQSEDIHSACIYSIDVYPTPEMEESFNGNLPIIILLTVLAFCALLAVGFLFYDRMTKIHQRNRMKSQAQEEQALLRIDHARQAAASERQLNEFIAHEVRNPLSAAMSACSFVNSAIQDLTALADAIQVMPLPRSQPATPTPAAPKPQFAIEEGESDLPPAPKPLFSIAPEAMSSSAPPAAAAPKPLFSINPEKTSSSAPPAEAAPKPLFSINPETTSSNAPLAAAPKPLFSIAPPPPYTAPKPLFSIDPTTTTASSAPVTIAQGDEEPPKPAPLFEIAATKAAPQPAPIPAPLFQIAKPTTAPEEEKPRPAPLFALPTAPAPPPPPPAPRAPPGPTKEEIEAQLAQEKKVQEQKESIMEDLHIIDSSLQFINELLRNMLDVQRAAHHQLKIEKAPTDILRDILEPVDAMLYRRGKSEVKVVTECPQDLMVLTDRLRLKQVVLNLSRNSAKFVEKGYIKLKVVVVNGSVQVWIEDTGPGIPEEKKGQLFAKFQESLDSLSQGTGLGLSLCKILIGLLGGEITLDERFDSGMEGRPGAKFIIDLKSPPIQMEETENGESEAIVNIDAVANGIHHLNNCPEMSLQPTTLKRKSSACQQTLPASLKVLFVDDDTVLRKLFVRATRRIVPGWHLQEAASGEAALRLIDEYEDGETHFDMIFMDQYMASTEKQLLGTESTKALRSKGVKSIICGLSANDMAKDFFEAGANGFICKPLPAQKDILHECLLELLATDAPGEQAPRKKCSLVLKPPTAPAATPKFAKPKNQAAQAAELLRLNAKVRTIQQLTPDTDSLLDLSSDSDSYLSEY